MVDQSHLEKENLRLREAVEELAALNDIAAAIGSSLDVTEINSRIVSKVVKRVRASQGAIFLLGLSDQQDSMQTVVRAKASSVDENPVHMGMALTGWMIKHQRILNISRNNDPDGLLRHMPSDVTSALSVPLRTQGKMIGTLTLFNKLGADGFTEPDQRFVTIVAGQSAQVIESARLLEEEKRHSALREELKMAGTLQRSLMPDAFPQISGYDIHARNEPAGEVGGDCYDVFQIDERRALVSLGDVAGKGASAALMMANAQAIIRSQFSTAGKTKLDLANLVQAVSEYLAHWSGHDKYITLFLAVLDADRHVIDYVNAGHNPPALRRPDGSVEFLEVGGIPMGMFPGMSYTTGSVPFEPGARLVVFTDGVTELFNEKDEEFGDTRLIEFIHGNATLRSAAFADELYATLRAFRGKRDPSDDITLLTVLRNLQS